MSGPAMLAVEGMPVFISKWVPAYEARHPSVQRWWPRVLKHLGEAEGGEPKFFVVGGAVHIHPDVFDKVAGCAARAAHRLTGCATSRSDGDWPAISCSARTARARSARYTTCALTTSRHLRPRGASSPP